MIKRISLSAKLLTLFFIVLLLQTSIFVFAQFFSFPLFLTLPLSLLLCLSLVFFGINALLKPSHNLLKALTSGVLSFQDNDFSVQIHNEFQGELGQLVNAYNALAKTMKKERMSLFQRELLLDTIMQSTPVSIVLINENDQIVYSNLVAQKLFNIKGKLEGLTFSNIINTLNDELSESCRKKQSGLVTINKDDKKQTYYLSCQHFQMNMRQHTLYLFKDLTTEISRQEINLWKNAIRLISHELNNSLAPIASLTSSALKILNKPEHFDMLPDILITINRRADNLKVFLEQYAQFARLPEPTKSQQNLALLISSVQRIYAFSLKDTLPNIDGYFDATQIEQVLINLLKNAHESQCDIEDIVLKVVHENERLVFALVDRGTGMKANQLQQALLPFFSTKEKGTGLGLSLCNEVISAHDGQLKLANREQGGLLVQFDLPAWQAGTT
ncbi:sensor histidine kinase [Pseudoalteromonas denitrificans]|uniref:histidine kinase n=1 Tax=Pseudoalteromonas denitrificans DSM 6059 TaxID=1123010 RepID=A0A1I1EKM6_9GAMM|nr:ATP-binding protein [Pseudoalteromonas denitrificans]SFB87719.1 Histidine kinase-, DNA gyrase B-, and HSP90-like ATPase [Pseudoalteromonas denitrificans DSM 6059]